MSVSLDRIDSAPIANSDFDYQFLQWIWVLVDTLNENLISLEFAFDLFTVTNYTQAEILAFQAGGQLGNGVILYDTTSNVYVGRQNGSLVKFTTASYP